MKTHRFFTLPGLSGLLFLPLLLSLSAAGARADEPASAAAPPSAFVRPPYLKRGDTVALVSPAGRLPDDCDTALIRGRFASWGLHVLFGAHCCDRGEAYFSAPDSLRAADLQAALDDPSVKAVIACRGGYGSVRLFPLLDLERLRDDPKWPVGFSDITALHLALRRLGIESIHGPMPSQFRFDAEDPSAESLRSALFGETVAVETPPHPCNRPGRASGRLVGGNLTMLSLAAGTPEALRCDEPAILFIEEVGEYVYRLDRMLRHLERSGALQGVAGVVVGHLTETPGAEKFGFGSPCEAVAEALRPLGVPVAFGFPAGHERPNLALFLGREATLEVTDSLTRLKFRDAAADDAVRKRD